MESGRNIKAIWPDEYSNQSILAMDEITNKWFNAKLTVNRLSGNGKADYDVNSGEYLLVYATNISGTHAVYIKELEAKKKHWICVNSWGPNDDPDPKVPVNQIGNIVYRITVDISPAQYLPQKVICVVGGKETRLSSALKTMEHYNSTLTRKWSMQVPMMTPRWGLAVAVLHNKIYAIGGLDDSKWLGPVGGKILNSVEVFDPTTGSWHYTADMNDERYRAGAAVLDDHIIVCGGVGGGKELDTVERYDATSRSWTRMPNMVKCRSRPAVVQLNGRIFVLGGGEEKSVEVFNEASQTWEMSVPMRSVRSGHGAATIGGKIFVVGGCEGPLSALMSGEVYDPQISTWTRIADMREKRNGVAVVALDGRLWAIGGFDNGKRLSSVEVYSVTTNTWEIVDKLNTPRCGIGAAVLCL